MTDYISLEDYHRLTKAKPRATKARRCPECGGQVGKGRKALACAPCEFVAALRTYAPALPAPQRELDFALPERKWSADAGWPARGVLVELDGGQYVAGGGRHNTDSDRDKLNHAAAMGYRVLRFSPQQLARDPAACVALVVRALEARGLP